MYHVLIVDDEAIIREGIRTILPWQSLGVETVLTAASGEQAIELLTRESVDLMITDICMVNMNGLELIAKVNEVKPDMRIIVLTGYNSFEYSQQCCRMEVHDFLLKPIDEDELEAAVKKQLQLLHRREQSSKRNRMLSRAHGLTDQVRLETVMRALLNGREDAPLLAKRMLEKFSYAPTNNLQCFVVLPLLETGDQQAREAAELMNLTAKSLCIEMFDAQNQGLTFDDSDGRIVVIAFVSAEFEDLDVRINDLRGLLLRETGRSFTLLLGSSVADMRELPLSYHDALALLSQVSDAEPRLIRGKSETQRLQCFQRDVDLLTDQMSELMEDETAFTSAFEAFERCMERYAPGNALVRRTVYRLASTLYYVWLVETGNTADDRLCGFLNAIRDCDAHNSYRLAREFLVRLLFSSGQSQHEIVRQIKRYVNEHLSQELSVSTLAASHFITINYLSRLFKRETGEGCNEYIVRKRMEKAKGLLESTSMKSGQIAIAVGYKDMNYFSLAFKKYVGVSPTEYRERIRQE